MPYARFAAGLALIVVTVAPAQADIAGAAAGAGLWRAQPDGWVQNQDGDRFDFDDELELDDDTGGYFWAAVEHPLPLLPNVRLEYTPVDVDGRGELSRRLTFRDVTFAAGSDARSTVEFDQLDTILYYEMLDNVVSLDLGLNIKYVDGFVRVREQTTGLSDSVSFDAPLPLLYGAARLDLPLTGLWLGGQASGLAYDGNRLLDARLGVGYELGFGLGVEAGYRRQELELDDVDDVSADVEIGGVYAGAYLDF